MIQLFLDGADLPTIHAYAKRPDIKGFTTNPSLMRQAGVTNYQTFAKSLLECIPDRPVSFEVLADEPAEMVRQGKLIASWADNVMVKIPIMNTRGASMGPVIQELSKEGIEVNVTAVLTIPDVSTAVSALEAGEGMGIVSVFAGRIADTGRDPVPIMRQARKLMQSQRLLWASPRQVLDVHLANDVRCHIITLTPALLAKLPLFGKDLHTYTLETVRMFEQDGRESGLTLC